MPAALQPVSNKERVWIMDALRGFAILGIFLANLNSFSFYNDSAPNTGPYFSSFDHRMTFLHHMFLEGKFYSIFSFLFGWGIALQLGRGSDGQRKSVSFVRRRLFFMFLLGLAHLILLWIGDIVAFYALVGFVLLWMRNWKERTLLITAIILILSPILLYYIKMTWPVTAEPSFYLWRTGGNIGTRLTSIRSDEDFFRFNHEMNYFGLIKLNIAGVFFRYADLLFQSRIPKVLGMFLIGYLAGRNGRYRQLLNNSRLLWTIAIAGLVIGLPANYILARYMETDGGAYYGLKPEGWYRTIAYAIGVAPLATAYIALFFLLSKSRVGENLMAPLRPVGKMAFSNYILHSVIGTLVFLGLGLDLMTRVGPVYYTIFGILVFIGQMILSRIWLRYFDFGPVEWLWRTANYGKRQRMKKARTDDQPL